MNHVDHETPSLVQCNMIETCSAYVSGPDARKPPAQVITRRSIMHRSFGMESRPRSMKWDDLVRGPSRAEVRRHVRKIANYLAVIAS